MLLSCLLLCAALAPFQEESASWKPAPEAAKPRPTLNLREPRGGRLVVRGDQLVRVKKGEEQVLPCAASEGMGEIRDLAADLAGLVFVAAERGIFVVSREANWVDELKLESGAPSGQPTSVFVDGKRRVWVATDQALGVLDPTYYWGRTLTAEDGLPGEGPYRVADGGDGRLLVSCSKGVFHYRPDVGPAPRVESCVLGEKARASGSRLDVEYGVELPLQSVGSAVGGASYRYRLDGHHVWLPLTSGFELTGVTPGEHRLDVVAIDRDLNFSEPHSVVLAVGYPQRYKKSTVLAVALLAGLGVGAFFLFRAWRRGFDGSGLLRAGLSTGLTLVFALQLVAGIDPHAKGWPFMGFSMYTQSYGKNEVIYDAHLVGIDAKDRVRRIPEASVGVAIDDRWQVLRPLIDGGEKTAKQYLKTYNERHPKKPLVGLQVRSDRIRLTPLGPAEIAPLIHSHFRAPAAEGGG